MTHCSPQTLDEMDQEYQCGCHGGILYAITQTCLLIKEGKFSVGGRGDSDQTRW